MIRKALKITEPTYKLLEEYKHISNAKSFDETILKLAREAFASG